MKPHFHSDEQLADQAQEAAVLATCPRCGVDTPHQVEQVVEQLNHEKCLLAARCEVCAEQSLIVE